MVTNRIFQSKYISVAITLCIALMLIIAGPASAITMKVVIDNTAPTQGEEITFTVTTNVSGIDKYVPMTNLSLVLTKDGSTVRNVLFTPAGTLLSSSSGITIDPINPTGSSDYGFGEARDDLYGYGNGTSYSFGYGYGYAANNGAGGTTAIYAYNVTVNTSTFDTGEYSAQVILNTGNSAKSSFESLTTNFTVSGKVADVSSYVEANGTVNTTFTVAAASGNTTLTIPNGTIMKTSNGSALNTSITVGATTPNSTVSAALGSSESVVGKAVELGPAGATFSPYIQVRFNYTDDDISGIDEDELSVKFYNQTTDKWEVQTTAEHNKTANYIIANIEHFSTFAVTGTSPSSGGGSSSGSSGGGTGGSLGYIYPVTEEDNTTSSNETSDISEETQVQEETGTTEETDVSDQTESPVEEEKNRAVTIFKALVAFTILFGIASHVRYRLKKY